MSGDPGEDANSVQGLLREALDEEEQRLSALEERVQRLSERRSRGKLKERLAAGDEAGQFHTQRLPTMDIPPPGSLAEMLDDVEDKVETSLADLVDDAQDFRDDATLTDGFRDDGFRDSAPAPDSLEAPRPRGFPEGPPAAPPGQEDELEFRDTAPDPRAPLRSVVGADEDEEKGLQRAFNGPPSELLDDALAALEAPRPRGFRDDDSEESQGFRDPLPALPVDAFTAPKPRAFRDEESEFREPVLALPPDILEPPKPRGLKDDTETDLVVAGLSVGDVVVDEDAAQDLYGGDGALELAIPDDEQSGEGEPLLLPGSTSAAEPPRFSELSVDGVPDVDVDDAETEAARKLIEETGRQLRALERQLSERRRPEPAPVAAIPAEVLAAIDPYAPVSAEAPPVAPVPTPPPEAPPPASAARGAGPTPGAAKFGLDRAFGSTSSELTRVLDGQRRLLDHVEALSLEIDDMRASSTTGPAPETDALNARVERAEAAAAEAWRHVAEATGRTEKLVELVERIVERVGRLEERPAAPTSAPPTDAGTTQELIRLLRSGVIPRQDFSITGAIPRQEHSGAYNRPRDLLMATVKEHQELLREQARLLERLVKLEERTGF